MTNDDLDELTGGPPSFVIRDPLVDLREERCRLRYLCEDAMIRS